VEQFMRSGLVFDLGDSGGGDDVVVLLHGWPQDRHAWAQVTPLLTEAGLRVVAPDQRGYSPGAQPTGRAAYRMPELVADVLALVDALGESHVHLVGHDWGGAVAWAFAERHPERLLSLTVLSTPHHEAMAWAMLHGDQALRSWYVAAFQLPVLPELVLRRGLAQTLRSSGLPEHDVQRYAARFRRQGMASGGLGWYRAIPLGAFHLGGQHQRRISTPTTYVWGRHDPALGRAAAERTGDHVAADYSFVELDAGHWLPETHPHEVAAAILKRRRTVQQ
jgi:pimeloyl-ACP methyl ester carboxylesterase